MHDVLHRQLLVLPMLLGLVLANCGNARAEAASSAAQEIQAARLLEARLALEDSSADTWEKLREVYVGLTVKYPRDPAVRNAYGEFLWNREEPKAAVVQWQAAEALDPGYAPALDHLGGSFLAAGQARAAAAYFQRAVASEPENAGYQFSLANVCFLFRHELLDAAQPDAERVLIAALDHFARASHLAPGNAEYARAYAETFYSLARPDWKEALTAWQRFLEISPQKDFALLHLARVHLKLREGPEARACLARITDPAVDRVKKRLLERIDEELGPETGDGSK